MKAKANALMQKRTALLAQIAVERVVLAHQGAALRPAAQLIDKARMGFRFIQSHPALLLLPLTLVTLWRPRRLLGFAISGLGLWRMVRQGRHRLRS